MSVTKHKKAAPAKRRAAAKRGVKPAIKRSKVVSKGSPSVMRARVANLTKDIADHHYFVLANGKPVKHVGELAAILDQLEDHVFHHHVSPERNDFQNWIKDVFEDVELARKVSGVDDKKRLQLVIYKHMAGHE